MIDQRIVRRSRLASRMLASGLLAGLVAPQSGHAAISLCMSDPVVYLSGNVAVRLTSNVSTDVSNIRSIHYDLHIPKGMSVTRVVYTDGPIAAQESLNVYSNDSGNRYDSSTTVYSRQKVGVTDTEQAVSTLGTGTSTVSGSTNQTLSNYVQQ